MDAGWPCSFYEYQRNLKSLGHRLADIHWAIVTHFHMDHAGLIGEFLACGIRCFVFGEQAQTIDGMERTILKGTEYGDYTRIDQSRLVWTTADDFKSEMAEHGIAGDIVSTPGHSPESISYVTAAGEAIVGDLAPLDQIMEDDALSKESWRTVRALGAKKAFPSHAAPMLLP